MQYQKRPRVRLITVTATTLLMSVSAVAAPPSPFEAVPDSDSVLSILEPTPVGCRWWRNDSVSAHQQLLFEFDHPCKLTIAWSPNGRRAIVASSQERGTRAWVMEESGAVRALPSPPKGEIWEVGVDQSGGITALTYEPKHCGESEDESEEDACATQSEGLARAYVLDAKRRWKLLETTKSSITESDGSQGADPEVFRHKFAFGPTTSGQLDLPPEGMPVAAPELSERLKTHWPTDPDDGPSEWRQLPTESPVCVQLRFRGHSDEDPLAWTQHAVFVKPDELVDLEPEELNLVRARGPFVLAVRLDDPKLRHEARLYDVRTRRILYSSHDARVFFWPKL
jgi:hypothetical protein